MIESRRCPSTIPGAVWMPSSSGPRWARRASMPAMGPASIGWHASSAASPAMPHMLRDLAAQLGRYRAEAAPAIRVVVLDAHFVQARPLEPGRELAPPQVVRDRRNQAIEHDRAPLPVGDPGAVG